MSAFEATIGQKPDLVFLRVFDAIALRMYQRKKRNKLDETLTKCKFLGYSENKNAYRDMNFKWKRF
jgi:hypothetical protein